MADNTIIPYGASSPYVYNTDNAAATGEKPSAGVESNVSSSQPPRPRSELSGSLGDGRVFLFLPRGGNISNFSTTEEMNNGSVLKLSGDANKGNPSANMKYTSGNGDSFSFKSTPQLNELSASKKVAPNLTIDAKYAAHPYKIGNNFSSAGVNFDNGNTKMFAGYIDTGKNCSMAPAGIENNYRGLKGPLVSLDQQLEVSGYRASANVTMSQYNNDPNLRYFNANLNVNSPNNGPSLNAAYTESCGENRFKRKGQEFVSYTPSKSLSCGAQIPLPKGKGGQELSLSGGYQRREYPNSPKSNADTVSAGLKYSSPDFSVTGNCYNTSHPNEPRRNTSGAGIGVDWKKVHLGYKTENGEGWSNTTTEAGYSFNENISANYSHSENRPGNRSKETFGVNYQNPKSDLTLGLENTYESENGRAKEQTTWFTAGCKF